MKDFAKTPAESDSGRDELILGKAVCPGSCHEAYIGCIRIRYT